VYTRRGRIRECVEYVDARKRHGNMYGRDERIRERELVESDGTDVRRGGRERNG